MAALDPESRGIVERLLNFDSASGTKILPFHPVPDDYRGGATLYPWHQASEAATVVS